MTVKINYILLSILLILISIYYSNGLVIRNRRQDWNFPGAVDSGNGNNNARQSVRPTQSTTQSPNTETVTLPATGTIFISPCNRCMTTPQYNPVCGSDSRTYSNRAVLDCARMCGIQVEFSRLGVCETPR